MKNKAIARNLFIGRVTDDKVTTALSLMQNVAIDSGHTDRAQRQHFRQHA